jgi:hypothetical protein
VTVGATLVASLLATLGRPSTWPLGLATFLLRGGFLLVLAPIIVLPSAVGLGNVLAPLLETVVFRGVTPAIAILLASIVVGLLIWLVGGGLVAAAVEAELVRRIVADEETGAAVAAIDHPPVAHPAFRVLTVRLIALLPLLIALIFGAVRIVAVAYRELTVPSNVGVPLALRVVASAPDAVSLVIATWLTGETVGALAARRVVLVGDRVLAAVRAALVRLIRHPLRSATLAVVPLLPLALVLVLVALAGSSTWEALRAALSSATDPLVVLVLVLALVALFGGGLLLIGVISAWRAAVWALEVGGTFGAIGHGPVGFWNDAVDSGTLGDLRPRGVDPDTR